MMRCLKDTFLPPPRCRNPGLAPAEEARGWSATFGVSSPTAADPADGCEPGWAWGCACRSRRVLNKFCLMLAGTMEAAAVAATPTCGKPGISATNVALSSEVYELSCS